MGYNFLTRIRLEHNTLLLHLILLQVARRLRGGRDQFESCRIDKSSHSFSTFRKRQNWGRFHLCSLIHTDPDILLLVALIKLKSHLVSYVVQRKKGCRRETPLKRRILWIEMQRKLGFELRALVWSVCSTVVLTSINLYHTKHLRLLKLPTYSSISPFPNWSLVKVISWYLLGNFGKSSLLYTDPGPHWG